jgi:hypothetical protein
LEEEHYPILCLSVRVQKLAYISRCSDELWGMVLRLVEEATHGSRTWFYGNYRFFGGRGKFPG